MALEIETALMFYTTIFFTALYVIKKSLVYGIFTFATWWMLGLLWLVMNPTGTTAYSIGWFFHVIGWIFLMVVLAEVYDRWQFKKRDYEESELD